MRLLLEDGFSIDRGTGVGRYTRNLSEELAKYPEIEVLPQPSQRFIRGIRPFGARRVAYSAWLETGFQGQIAKLGADLVHFTNYLVPRTRRTKARYAVTIHDLTAWTMPEALPSIYGRYIRATVSRSVRISDLILCPSDSIRNEVIEHFKLPERLVQTAWNAVSGLPKLIDEPRLRLTGEFGRNLGLRKPFVLFVGTLERRKNLTTLVDAFARVARRADLQLVMVGRPGFGFSEIEAAIKRQANPNRYILPGYVSDQDLASLYTLADVFAYPSRYEGFGIPLVEAMNLGLPIVASRIPASEEVAADAAVYYDDPLDDEALAEKILEVLGNSALRSKMSSRGKVRAEKFRWENVARMYIEAYKSSLSGF